MSFKIAVDKSIKPKVVIYGAGQYGQFIARFAVEKGWPIAAVFNRAGSKVGQDIGRLAGLDRDLGIIVQDCDTASYENLDANIAIVTTTNYFEQNMPAYRRLLGAGLNVICHGVEAYYPYRLVPELAPEVDELAKKHGVTFTGSAIWDMSRLWTGITATGSCTELTSLYHHSVTNVVRQSHSIEQLVDIGVNLTKEEFYAKGLDNNPITMAYITMPEHVLDAIGYTITKSEGRIEPVIFDEDLAVPRYNTTIPAGRAVGVRILGEIDTKEGVTGRTSVEIRLVKEGEKELMHWEIEGKPRVRVTTERLDSDHMTIASAFNRIPDVIAAKPGIVLLSEMGPLKHTALL